MYLKHKDYVESEAVVKAVPDVKLAIKTFVGKGKKSHEEIVKEIQKTKNMTNDEIIKQIKEIAEEDNFKPVAIEVME